MKFFSKVTLGKRKAKHEPGGAEPVVITSTSWTRGEAMKTAALRVVIWALIAVGPLLGMAAWVQARHNAGAAVPEPAKSEAPGRAQASELAERAVVDWLTASRDYAPDGVGLYPNAQKPQQGLHVTNPSVSSAVYENHTWVVTVGVTITTTSPAEDPKREPVAVQHRRYFQQPVIVDAEGVGWITMLPAEVAGPAAEAGQRATHSKTVPVDDPVTQSVQGFLSAMLAGSGDIGRYISPGANIAAVSPAPYESIRIEQAMVDEDVPDPHDGATTSVFVRVQATQGEDSLRLEYLLTLTSRAQRWEVTAIAGAPTPKLPSSASSVPTGSQRSDDTDTDGAVEEGGPDTPDSSPTHS